MESLANNSVSMQPLYRSKLELRLKQLALKVSVAKDQQEQGMRHYVQVMQRLAAMSSSTIANTSVEYREAMETTSNTEVGVLKQINELVEAKVNCDSVQQLSHGDVVQVIHEGQLSTARIECLDLDGGVVDLMLWHKVEYTRSNYEEGCVEIRKRETPFLPRIYSRTLMGGLAPFTKHPPLGRGSLLPSLSADVRLLDDVIASFEGTTRSSRSPSSRTVGWSIRIND